MYIKINNETVITEDNVQKVGEALAISSVRTLAIRSSGKLDLLYKSLLYDVNKRRENDVYSDGYDVAQTAICFLWEHKGKRLGDYYGKDGKGRDCNILYACYHVLDKYIRKYRHIAYTTDSIDDERKNYDEIPVEDKKEDDYTVCDTIISKMNLKQGELDTLNCYMAGMTYCEIARFLDVNFSTVWRRRMSLQKKYMQAMF